MVSAWASANSLVLGQIKTDEKSNEITAIPELLKSLELKGCLVTIDAMGCQKNIAEIVISPEADYLLAVKDNQPTLHQAIQDLWKQMKLILKVIRLILPKLLIKDMFVMNQEDVGLVMRNALF
jgi:hypothetical protein